MATIERRERKGGVVYLADVRIKGFPRQKKTFKRLTDAKMWAQQTEAAIRTGEFKNVIKTAQSKTLKDVIKRYREDVLPHKAETTQRAEKSYVNFWERELGQYALSYITPELVTEKLKALSNAGDARRKYDDGARPNIKPKSRKTLKHYRDTLAMLFGYAKTWGWTGSNPLDGVNRITKVRNERVRFLSDEERQSLVAACKASANEQLYPIVVFALSTGARKSEILGLTFSDVDLDRGMAVLRDTKNGDTRSVGIVHHLQDVLKAHMEKVAKEYDKRSPKPPTRWVFPRSDGMEPIDIRKAWENARDEAGLDDFRFHDLRHTAASYLAIMGANQLEISEVLGHRTLQMVKRYTHLPESHTKGLLETLNKRMF